MLSLSPFCCYSLAWLLPACASAAASAALRPRLACLRSSSRSPPELSRRSDQQQQRGPEPTNAATAARIVPQRIRVWVRRRQAHSSWLASSCRGSKREPQSATGATKGSQPNRMPRGWRRANGSDKGSGVEQTLQRRQESRATAALFSTGMLTEVSYLRGWFCRPALWPLRLTPLALHRIRPSLSDTLPSLTLQSF